MTYRIIGLGQRARGGDEITNPVSISLPAFSCPVLTEREFVALENKANECMIGPFLPFGKGCTKSEMNRVYFPPSTCLSCPVLTQ